MKRIKLVVAYDGTNYCGWQKQENEITVEGEINKYLSELMGEEIQVIGASRTDSGVHAKGNVAVFDTESRIPSDKIMYALNARLPEDIRIVQSEEVDGDFHPRYCKCWKIYEYRILNNKVNLPMYRLYTNHVYQCLNMENMKAAANEFVGEHDFSSFCSAKAQVTDMVRTIYDVEIEKNQDEIITIRVCGNGFLYNMVRIMAGTLIEVGKGRFSSEDVKKILEGRDRTLAGPTAIAKGLTLIKIGYGDRE